MKIMIRVLTSFLCCVLLSTTSYSQTSSQKKVELIVPSGHSSFINSIDYTPDGKYLISGSHDNSARLWNAKTGVEIRTFTGHTDEIKSLSISRDGKFLLTAGGDEIIYWEIKTGKLLRRIRVESYFVDDATLSKDSRFAFSAGSDKVIKQWDLSSGNLVRTFEKHEKKITALALSPDGEHIVSTSLDKSILLWDISTGKVLDTISKSNSAAYDATFTPNGKKVLAGGNSNRLVLYALEGLKLARYFDEEHSKMISNLDISNDGRFAVSASWDKTLKVWDLNSPQTSSIRTLTGHTEWVLDVSISPDGKQIASVGWDKTIRIWDAKTGKQLQQFKNTPSLPIRSLFSNDGRSIFISHGNTIRQWDIQNSKLKQIFKGHEDRVTDLSLSLDGSTLASVSFVKREIKVWDVASGQEIHHLSGHTSEIVEVDFSENGKVLATVSSDKTIKLWDVTTGSLLKTLFNDGLELATSASFIDNKRLIAGYSDGRISVWDMNSGSETKHFSFNDLSKGEDTSARVWNLKPTPNHPFVVVAGSDKSSYSPDSPIKRRLSLFNFETGKIVFDLIGHSEVVYDVDVSPDGNVGISASSDNTLIIWDLSTGKPQHTLRGHSSTIREVDFSPDGKMAVSSSADGTVRLWDTKTGQELFTFVPFSDSNDWLATTTNGYFDGTSRPLKELYFVDGFEQLPIESFFEEYYTPGLIQQVLSGEKRTQPNKSLANGFYLPPKVEFNSPKSTSTVTSAQQTITITATDMGGGIDELRLYHNGKRVSDNLRGLKRAQNQASITKNYSITLVSGKNTFQASAFNNDRIESIPIELNVTLDQAKAGSRLFILAVGLNEYRNSILNLNYGKSDAQAFVEQIKQSGKNIFSEIIVTELYDKKVTKENLLSSFKTIQVESNPEDVFMFFYAGHGVMSESTEDKKGDFYIIPYNITQLYGNEYQLENNGFSATELKQHSSQIAALKQLMFLDACQSGGAIETFALRGAAEQKAIAQLSRSTGQVVLAAAGSQQFATEFSELGHGVFTYALLEGLRGKADKGSNDGKITVNELSAYLEDLVPELTEKYRGQSQFPNRYGYGQDFPIGIIEN